jgi:DNA replication protein DnaC
MDHSLNAYNRATGGNFTSVSMKIDDLGSKEIICEEHGGYITHGVRYLGKHEVWSKCPDCKEAEQAKERMEKARAEMERQQAQLSAMIDEACIPARFIGRTFDNFRANSQGQAAALSVAKEYVENFKKHKKNGTGLIFSGLPGTGKSHLAAAILQGVMPDNAGLYITCMGLIRAVRGTWRKDSEQSESEVLRNFCNVPLLVLDEIGVQYGTDGEQTILFDVLDRRYREMRPTILLTNQATAGFKEFIGERSFDRLVETSRWVPFDWESYRATARKESSQ